MRLSRFNLSLLLISVCFLALMTQLRPNFANVELRLDDEIKQTTVPVYFSKAHSNAQIAIQMELARLHPTEFQIIPDDCLEKLTINGRPVSEGLPYCDWRNGRDLDLSNFLHPGQNLLELEIKNKKGQGSVEINIAKSDPLTFALRLGFLLSFAWLAYRLIEQRYHSSPYRGLFYVGLVGIVIRIIYFYATPFWVRGYDWNGHIKYLQYVVDHFALPAYNSGWQSYQPPLYYFFCGIIILIGQIFGYEFVPLERFLQYVSLFISFVTVAVELGCVALLAQQRSREWPLVLSALWLVTLPSLVMFSGRISNDIFYYLFTALSLFFFLKWWRTDSLKSWIAVCLSLTAALLSKSNAINIIAVAIGGLAIRQGIQLPRRAGLLLLLGLIVGLGNGWYFYQRFAVQGQPALVGNINSNPKGLRVENDLSAFTTFDPEQVLTRPYNHTWDDNYRRKYFWEFLYRSVFFAEFRHGEHKKFFASVMLLLGMGVFTLSVVGVVTDWRRKAWYRAPLILTGLAMVGSLFAVRYQHNISGFSDFRYIPLAAFPIAYFAGIGLGELHQHWRRCFQFVFEASVFCNALFLVALYFSDPR